MHAWGSRHCTALGTMPTGPPMNTPGPSIGRAHTWHSHLAITRRCRSGLCWPGRGSPAGLALHRAGNTNPPRSVSSGPTGLVSSAT